MLSLGLLQIVFEAGNNEVVMLILKEVGIYQTEK